MASNKAHLLAQNVEQWLAHDHKHGPKSSMPYSSSVLAANQYVPSSGQSLAPVPPAGYPPLGVNPDPIMKPANASPVNETFLGQTTVTTATTTVTTTLRDGAMTIKRMKQMAEEQHHRGVELQAANGRLKSQVNQAQGQVAQLQQAFQRERQVYSDLKTKQQALDKHIEDFNGILESVDVKHLKLSSNLQMLTQDQEKFDARLSKASEEMANTDSSLETNLQKYISLEKEFKRIETTVDDIHSLNKELSEEVVKCRAMVSEKDKHILCSNQKLDELRAKHIKLESSFSQAKAKYDSELTQKTSELTSKQDNLAKTVSSLNEMLVSRQNEIDARKCSDLALSQQKAKLLQYQKSIRGCLQKFEKTRKGETNRLGTSVEDGIAKWEASISLCQERVKLVRGKNANLQAEVRKNKKELADKSDKLEKLTDEKKSLEKKVSDQDCDLRKALEDLEETQSDLKVASEAKDDLQRKLLALKEEQKQYCLSLSNTNANELKKMKCKMDEEVKRIQKDSKDQLRSKDESFAALKQKLADAEKKVKDSENETKTLTEKHNKEMDAAAKRNEIVSQEKSDHEARVRELESSLADMQEECTSLKSKLENAIANAAKNEKANLSKENPTKLPEMDSPGKKEDNQKDRRLPGRQSSQSTRAKYARRSDKRSSNRAKPRSAKPLARKKLKQSYQKPKGSDRWDWEDGKDDEGSNEKDNGAHKVDALFEDSFLDPYSF